MRKINCILLVDDDQISNFITQKLLMKLNIADRIMTIINGYDALNFIAEYHQTYNRTPEIILIDVNMPELNGFEFLTKFENLNLSNNHSKAIMLTASSPKKNQTKLTEFDVIDCIEKPLTKEKIELIIKKIQLSAR